PFRWNDRGANIGAPQDDRGDILSPARGVPRRRRGASERWGVWGAISGPPTTIDEPRAARGRGDGAQRGRVPAALGAYAPSPVSRTLPSGARRGREASRRRARSHRPRRARDARLRTSAGLRRVAVLRGRAAQ